MGSLDPNGGGNGDMLKSVYDTGDNGVVDNSEKLENSTKAEVQTHTPQSHNHVEGDLNLTDITTNDASTSKHGLLKKLTGDVNKFLRADGTFAVVSGAGGAFGAYDFLCLFNNPDYEAYNMNGVLTYGGASDAGGVDGADFGAVVNACITAGYNIVFLDGVYTIGTTTTIIMNKSSVKLRAISKWRTEFKSYASYPILQISTSSESRSSDTVWGIHFRMQGNNANCIPITVGRTHDLLIEDCFFSGYDYWYATGLIGTAIKLDGTGGYIGWAVINRCVIYQFTTGIQMGNVGSGSCNGCLVQYGRVVGCTTGLKMDYGDTLEVFDVDFTDNATGIAINGRTDYSARHRITDCRFEANTTDIVIASSVARTVIRGGSPQTITDNGSFTLISELGGGTGFTCENTGNSTGTGSQQTIPHGCNFTPTYDQVTLSERTTGGADPHQTQAPSATNIYVTATSGKDYTWNVRYNNKPTA